MFPSSEPQFTDRQTTFSGLARRRLQQKCPVEFEHQCFVDAHELIKQFNRKTRSRIGMRQLLNVVATDPKTRFTVHQASERGRAQPGVARPLSSRRHQPGSCIERALFRAEWERLLLLPLSGRPRLRKSNYAYRKSCGIRGRQGGCRFLSESVPNDAILYYSDSSTRRSKRTPLTRLSQGKPSPSLPMRPIRPTPWATS